MYAIIAGIEGDPIEYRWTGTGGTFADPSASATTFTCADLGDQTITITASDDGFDYCTCDWTVDDTCVEGEDDSGGGGGFGGGGGSAGDGGIGGAGGNDGNICPNLNIINAIPSTIRPGNTSTMVQTRAQETDGLPLPLMLTLRALWGSFENIENIPMSGTVVGQNATYNCDRPGEVEICVDATDGACTKPLCTNVTCPDDVSPP